MPEANFCAEVSGTKDGDDGSSSDDDAFPEPKVEGDSDTDPSQEHRPDKEAVKAGKSALSRDPFVNNKLPLNPMPDCPDFLSTKTTEETKEMAEQVLEITKDFQRLNMGDVAKANWHINGIKIIPSRSKPKVRFQSEVTELEYDQTEMEQVRFQGKPPKLPRIPPIRMADYGRIPRVKPALSQVRRAMRERRQLKEEPTIRSDRILAVFGITSPTQIVQKEDIVMDLSKVEIRNIHRIIIRLSDATNKMVKDGTNDIAQILCRLLFQKPLSVGQTIANFAKENGSIRPDMVRRQLKNATKELGLEVKI
jgi:hypothetical protein